MNNDDPNDLKVLLAGQRWAHSCSFKVLAHSKFTTRAKMTCFTLMKSCSFKFCSEMHFSIAKFVNLRRSKLKYPSGSSSYEKRHMNNLDEGE